jgi:hypothetical protein
MGEVIPGERDTDRTPVVQGVIPGECGRPRRVASRTMATGAPNTPLQPTASRARSLVFDTLVVARSRLLNGNPLGGSQSYGCLVFERRCSVLWLTNAVLLGWNESSVGCRPVVLGVVLFSAVSRQVQMKAGCAGCGCSRCDSTERSCPLVSAHVLHASVRHSIGAAAQPAAVADRFAREIVRFLGSITSARGG